jgi:hypothetical protein
MHRVGFRRIRKFNQGRCKVGIRDRVLEFRPGFDEPGIAHEERCAVPPERTESSFRHDSLARLID